MRTPFYFVILDFFLRYACLFLSFPYPFVFLSSILSVVLLLLSAMIFSTFHALLPSVYLSFVFSFPTFLSFPSFLFLFTLSPFSPFSLSSLFACLFTQGDSLLTKQ
jgi:hypothetical protein